MLRHLGLLCGFLALVVGCASDPTPKSPTAGVAAPGTTSTAVPSESADGSAPATNLIPAVVGLPPQATSSTATYLIGPGDLIQMDVFKVPELSTKDRVNEAGVMIVPLIGPVTVGGLTPEQAGQLIATELAKDHLQNPQVNLLVLESASMNITVGGAVKKPGVFPMKGPTTLLQAISMAEGVTDVAKQEEVVVFRARPGQGINAYVVDLKQVQSGALADPMLAVNDKVMVPESGSAVFVKSFTGALRGFVSVNPLFY